MSGLFATFNAYRRAVSAHQTAINTTSHNISNADTEGYSRQLVTMKASRALGAPALNSYAGPGQIGTGVEVSEISRARDMFLDRQIRDEQSTAGKYGARDEFLSEIEVLTLEPSYDDGPGISILMGKMWDAWHELSNNPESSNTKTGVVQAAKTFTDALNHIYSQLDNLKGHSMDLAQVEVTDFNSLVTQIDDLNRQIGGVEVMGKHANDLLDQQDVLIDKLSNMMDISVERNEFGRVTITTKNGSDTVTVVGDDRQELIYDDTTDSIGWGDVGSSVIDSVIDFADKNGSIAGYVSICDEIQGYQDKMDDLAKAVAYTTNMVHTGNGMLTDVPPIFVGTGNDAAIDNITAGNITVNSSLVDDPSGILASYENPAPGDSSTAGDGSRALAIAQLRDVKLGFPFDTSTITYDSANMTVTDSKGTTNMDGYYRNMIVELGASAAQASSMVTGQDELLNQLQIRKESISGVNIDEETTYLIQYQHALNAAFKGISVIDELLQSVINLVR